MTSLLVSPASFLVDGGKFSSEKRYLHSTQDRSGVFVVLPVMGSFTIDLMSSTDPVPFNIQYSIEGYTQFTQQDTGFTSESEAFMVQR